MITFREAQVAAGRTVAGSVAGVPDLDAAWLIWRLEVVRSLMGAGSSAITDYTIVEKRSLKGGTVGAAFAFRIPDSGPISYEGKLIRIVWEIVVGTDPNNVAEYAGFKVVAGQG